MIVVASEETVILVFWVVAISVSLVLGMRSDDQKQQQGGVPCSGRTNGFIPSSFRAISSYLRIVSSGASTVARSAASVASSIVERDDDTKHDQVIWAGFDKVDCEGELSRKVLLLGYRSGFQVWNVQDADNVCDLVSVYCGPVSFMQMLPKPLASNISDDRFGDFRPLLVICVDGSRSGTTSIQDGFISNNGGASNYHDQRNGNFMPTIVQFYSLRSQSYVHVLKFRSVVFTVRCSSRVVAISQETQIHCFNATTLERVYTIITNPISVRCPGSGGTGYGPLAVGPRWLAYSGSPVAVSNSGRVSPQHLKPSASFPGFSSNGSLVAHYAKESSKQLAAGIVTLGDMGYKKLSRYCSELLPDNNNNLLQTGSPALKANGVINGHSIDNDSVGMVIVRDIICKTVIAQFRAHRSPISALCFDPSGTLLVTASVQGHNINVYKIMLGYSRSSSSSDAGPSYIHLYRLQRGLTNAVIQDISFSDDSNWIVISSSRGTSHVFAINSYGGFVNIQSDDGNSTPKSNGFGVMTKSTVRWPPNSATQVPHQQSLVVTGPPLTLSAVSRIRNGSNGWKGSVTGAAAAATGRVNPNLGAIASCFHNSRGDPFLVDSKAKYHMLVFSPTGFMMQYLLRISTSDVDSMEVSELAPAYESTSDNDARLVVEAIQKWGICQRSSRREREDTADIYGDNGISDSSKIYPEELEKGNSISSETKKTDMKPSPSSDEKHHLYISEAELQMHQARTPLWAKPEIYFQSMMEGIETDDVTAPDGEFEIEGIPTRMIEARSRDLVPVFDYAQTPKLQKTMASALDSNNNTQLLHQNSWLSENEVLPRSSSVSSHFMGNTSEEASKFQSDFEGNGRYKPHVPLDHKDCANTNYIPKPNTRLEIVNNRESLEAEAQLKLVNNYIEGLEMENCFRDGGDDF